MIYEMGFFEHNLDALNWLNMLVMLLMLMVVDVGS